MKAKPLWHWLKRKKAEQAELNRLKDLLRIPVLSNYNINK